jgi:hypothetical protein
MKAQIYNDARGWDDLANALAAESEPTDPAAVWGNFTHEELHDVMDGGGYGIVVPISMSNDYFGYIASYREFQGHDHYRKALTGLGPHSADWFATRLSRMAASLKGAPAVAPGPKDLEAAAENARMEAVAQTVGSGARAFLPPYEATLPADGGAPRITVQPADVTRFDAAVVGWVGGSNFTDTPHTRVERCAAEGCDPADPAAWELFATGESEVQQVVDFPAITDLPMLRAGQFEWQWTATFEAFSSDIVSPDALGRPVAQTPAGIYRFVISGCHRGATPTATPNTPSDGCGSWDALGRVQPYELTSEPFDVRPWDGLTVEDLRADGRTVSFTVGPRPAFPVSASNSSHLAVAGGSPVDYPDSYDSPIVFLDPTESWVRYGDSDGDGERAGDADDERFCFHCTFRPWADTGTVVTAVVSWQGSSPVHAGQVAAAYDAATGRWRATLPPQARTAWVAVGAVRDGFGESNGAPSAPVAVMPGRG